MKNKPTKRKKSSMASIEIPSVVTDEKIKKIESVLKKDRKVSHYVNNSKLLEEMVAYRKLVQKFKSRKGYVKGDMEGKPKVPEYIGECILVIAERLSTRPNFFGYTYRDEMIGDGIENSLMYIDNFDPEKSSNPFAYITQIIYYAFIRRIQREKKQAYVKMKKFENEDVKGQIRSWARKQNLEIDEENPYRDLMKLTDMDVKYWDLKANKKDPITGTKKKKVGSGKNRETGNDLSAYFSAD